MNEEETLFENNFQYQIRKNKHTLEREHNHDQHWFQKVDHSVITANIQRNAAAGRTI